MSVASSGGQTVPVPVPQHQQGKIVACRLSANPCKVPFYTPEYIADADVPICRYAFLLFQRVIPNKECNNHPATHTKDRFARYKCTFPLCNPPK